MMSKEPQLNDFDIILKRKFYVADCELVQFSADRNSTQVKLNASGCAALVSGDIELEFNWVAKGRASTEREFTFVVSLDEAEPDFYLIGIDDCAAETVDELCKKILASCKWQTEVAECLPKNETELASL